MAGGRRLTARQLRWLFATGRLRASGKGKDRKVTYSREGGKRPDFSATRAARIAAGQEQARRFIAQTSSRAGYDNVGTRPAAFLNALHRGAAAEKKGGYFSAGYASDRARIVKSYKRDLENARLARTPGALSHLSRAQRIARSRQIAATESKLVKALRSGNKSKAEELWRSLGREAKNSGRRDWSGTADRLRRLGKG